MNKYLMPLAAGLLLALAVPSLRADDREVATLTLAGAVARELVADLHREIPPALVRDAAGVAFIPHGIKGGFLFGGRYGRGVALARRQDGTWADPVFVTLMGGSIGGQLGIEVTDLILVFRTKEALERALQGSLTLGPDAALAIGTLGLEAESADAVGQLRAVVHSYSKSYGGLFAGVSLEGARLRVDPPGKVATYRGEAEKIAAVAYLKGELDKLATPPAAATPAVGTPPIRQR
jgi:lipid-binding SYLF domain-containing protein